MPQEPGTGKEILSVAVWEPVPDMEAVSLATVRDDSIVGAKGYGRDLLCRDRESHYLLIRHWKSEDARRAASEIPTCFAAGPAWEMKSKS